VVGSFIESAYRPLQVTSTVAGVGRPGGERSGSMINDVVEQVCFLLFCVAGRVIVRWAVSEWAEEALRAVAVAVGGGCGVWFTVGCWSVDVFRRSIMV
jgi:hypothetical protein